MTATFQAAGDLPAPTPVQRLWQRQLHRYPNNGARYFSLGIVVAVTVILYYQQYLAGGVGSQVIRDTGMSFTFFVYISVVANLVGSLASILTGVADRYGRANIVVGGLGVTSLLVLFGIPATHSQWGFAVLACVIGFVEGTVLVATPALIRDFSPQLGRASAMGFWTIGPVVGSLLVSILTSATFKGDRTENAFGWFFEYRLCGIISLVIFAVALFGLRELAPALRDQLMVSEKDRALIEMRAKGLNIEESLKKPFRQMMRVDIVASAFAISVFLIIYYIAVGFFPIFFETVFGYSASKANGIGNFFWLVDALALIGIGYASDKLRVRKPFMIVGGVLAVVFTTTFALRSTGSGSLPSYGFLVGILILLSVSLGIAYAPWMASYTETVENHNPALTATGLAVWGMIIRLVVAVAVFVAPHIVSNVSPIINKAAPIQAAEANKTVITTAAGDTTVGQAFSAAANPANATLLGQLAAGGKQYGTELATAAKVDAATLAALKANPADQAAGIKAISEISGVSVADVTTIATASAQHAQAIAAGQALDQATAATLLTNPSDQAAAAKAVGEVVQKLGVSQAQAVSLLTELKSIPVGTLLLLQSSGQKVVDAQTALAATAKIPADVATLFGVTAPKQLGAANFLAITSVGTAAGNADLGKALAYAQANGADIVKLQADSRSQWRNYFWVAIGGEIVFIPLVLLMAGYWSPRKARKAEEEHEAMVAAETAKLAEA